MRRPALLLACVALVAAGCGGGSSTPTTTTAAAGSGCRDVARPAARAPAKLKPPTTGLDPSKRWTLTFTTSCGTFVVTLAPHVSRRATASLVSLARQGYFDDTIFHRIVPGYIIQGGDPTQSGRGGPGYKTVDPPGIGTRYLRGTMAMGKTPLDPRGAAGSQFFVMTGDAPSLAPDYAVVGRVTGGMGVVARIGKLGDVTDPAGTPSQTVVVEHVTAASR
jgi:peptidyl-prolyl cis-trans isomerase B (cyclophilin B)